MKQLRDARPLLVRDKFLFLNFQEPYFFFFFLIRSFSDHDLFQATRMLFLAVFLSVIHGTYMISMIVDYRYILSDSPFFSILAVSYFQEALLYYFLKYNSIYCIWTFI